MLARMRKGFRTHFRGAVGWRERWEVRSEVQMRLRSDSGTCARASGRCKRGEDLRHGSRMSIESVVSHPCPSLAENGQERIRHSFVVCT